MPRQFSTPLSVLNGGVSLLASFERIYAIDAAYLVGKMGLTLRPHIFALL